MYANAHLSDLEYRAGNWDRAIVHGEHAESVAVDADQAWQLPFVRSTASYTWSRRGSWQRASALVSASTRDAVSMGTAAGHGYACTAAAILAHSQGDSHAVVDATERGLEYLGVDGIFEPGFFMWPELRIEGLIRTDRLDEAGSLLARRLEIATDRYRHTTLAVSHRVKGLLEAARGRSNAALDAFETAQMHAGAVEQPFEHALLHLQHGGHLRRIGQRKAAAAQLRRAEEVMTTLGAKPFVMAVQGAAACGLTPRKRRAGATRRSAPPENSIVGQLLSRRTHQQGGGTQANVEPEDRRLPPWQRVHKAWRTIPRPAGKPDRQRLAAKDPEPLPVQAAEDPLRVTTIP